MELVPPNPNQLAFPHHFTTPRVLPILRLVEAPPDDFIDEYDNVIPLFPEYPDLAA